jgi:hypothetical protein
LNPAIVTRRTGVSIGEDADLSFGELRIAQAVVRTASIAAACPSFSIECSTQMAGHIHHTRPTRRPASSASSSAAGIASGLIPIREREKPHGGATKHEGDRESR